MTVSRHVEENVGAAPPQHVTLTREEITRDFLKKDAFGDLRKVAVYEALPEPQAGGDQGLIHFMDPYDKHPVVVTLPTKATREEVDELSQKISPVREFSKMIAKLAECYQSGIPLIIEGGTAIGKTFMVNQFVQLLYGKGVKPLDVYLSGQTDVSDLMGKWVPSDASSPELKMKWDRFIESEEGQRQLQAIGEKVQRLGADATKEQKEKMYQTQLSALARDVGLRSDGGFTYEDGPIPKAFGGEYVDGHFRLRDGAEGFIAHIQEPGLAKPSVLNALFRIRGEQGEIADSIQMWEADGRIIRRGPRTFFVFTNNPVDGFLDRKPICPALARGLDWIRFDEGLSEQSVMTTARKIFTYSLGNKRAATTSTSQIFDITQAPELGMAIAEAMVAVHQTMSTQFEIGESDDPQRNPIVMDNMFKVARNLQCYHVAKGKSIDMGRTLYRAIERTYLERARPSERVALTNLVEEQIFGKTGVTEFEGRQVKLADKLDVLAERAISAQSQVGENTLEKTTGKIAGDAFMSRLTQVQKGLRRRSP